MTGQFQILATVASDPGGLAKIYAGRVISGVGVGAISAVAPAYVSECSPKEVRGRITGIFQMMVMSSRLYTVKTINRASRLPSAS
jgi:MFS family permease